jgi:hypothetical protein
LLYSPVTNPRLSDVVRSSKIVSSEIHAPTENAPSNARETASPKNPGMNGNTATASP